MRRLRLAVGRSSGRTKPCRPRCWGPAVVCDPTGGTSPPRLPVQPPRRSPSTSVRVGGGCAEYTRVGGTGDKFGGNGGKGLVELKNWNGGMSVARRSTPPPGHLRASGDLCSDAAGLATEFPLSRE